MSRTYNQECLFSYALDILGERWTLLILRELLLGPRRFGDIHSALPGIGTNLLSSRLKDLERASLIASDGAARSDYKLTYEGENLRPTVRALLKWSILYFMHRTTPSEPRECIYSDRIQPDAAVLACEMFCNLQTDNQENHIIHLTIDDNPYTFFMVKSETTARRGINSPASASINTDIATIMKKMRGEHSIEMALKKCTCDGDEAVILRFFEALSPGENVSREVSEMISRDSKRRAEKTNG